MTRSPAQYFPPDWREQLIAILSRDGITIPPPSITHGRPKSVRMLPIFAIIIISFVVSGFLLFFLERLLGLQKENGLLSTAVLLLVFGTAYKLFQNFLLRSTARNRAVVERDAMVAVKSGFC